MRILVYSDLHLESSPFVPPDISPDILILAGDIDHYTRGIDWALNYFKDIPVIYIPGNHEYDNSIFPDHLAVMQAACLNTNVRVLDLASCVIQNVEFFGCSMWTDFALHGDSQKSKEIVHSKMNDYRCIKHGDGFITPDIIAEYYKQSLSWLQQALANSTAKYKVVITHHAPSKLSVSEDFLARDVAAAYVNQLDDFIKQQSITLWVHGHTHQKIDYKVGATRIVSNPRGHRGSRHQLKFNPEEIIVLAND